MLEADRRLSESLIWTLQRRFFEDQGIEAWRQAIVPHFITSNAFIADAYARVVDAFLRDCQAGTDGGDETGTPLDPAQPVYILELGAGSGRFAHLFLHRLIERRRRVPQGPRFVYVMTDLAERNIDFWQAHASLHPFVGAGVLDFARLDIGTDLQIDLRVSGLTLAPGTLRNPLVVLANYFFDGLPLDAFGVVDGRLSESRVTTLCEADLEPTGPAILEHLRFRWTSSALADYVYEDPDFNAVLRGYTSEQADIAVHFPIAALECCRLMMALSGGRMLMLSSDKGHTHGDALQDASPPEMAVHGSFSMSVSYHVLGRYFQRRGGEMLSTPHRPASLAVVAFLLGEPRPGWGRTRDAFGDAVQAFGPDDFFTLKSAIGLTLDKLDLDALLAVVRFARHDPELLRRCLPDLIKRAETATEAQAEDLCRAIDAAWTLYFPIGEDDDLAFELGRLLFTLDRWEDAARYFERSLLLHGPDPQSLFCLALCHSRLQRWAPALERVNESLGLAPGYDAARKLRIELRLRIGR